MFDWKQLLESRNIDYVHTSRSQIEIQCPLCIDDPSRHLSISLDGKGWRCWRHPETHFGRDPTRLVQALLRCSWEQAKSLTGSGIAPPDDLYSQVSALLSPTAVVESPDVSLLKPIEFRPFNDGRVASRPFISYLMSDLRGAFGYDWIIHSSDIFDVYYCKAGAYGGRIVFLIHFEKRLVAWTGRTIVGDPLRYKTLSTNSEKAKREGYSPALRSVGHCLLWYDELIEKQERKILYLCEGPFDALKLRALGVDATCFFTATPSSAQIQLLHSLSRVYDKIILLLDQGTLSTAIDIASRLSSLNIEVGELPSGYKDPCMLPSKHLLPT